MPSQNLYIHIPFCARKCFYCSFVIAVGQEKRIDAYLEQLEREASGYAGTTIDAVYVGGGTPTLLSDEQLNKMLRIIKKQFAIRPGAEWTIEANPEGVDERKLHTLREAGVNRVSLGVQSFNDGYLKFLGRNHDARKAKETFQLIKRSGFENVSVDLMFGFPHQTTKELEGDLKAMIELGSTHVSLYALTLEENSRFHVQGLTMPADGHVAEQYNLIRSTLETHGFEQYEVSNFAKKGYACEHNKNYWRGGNYIGLGIGAHSHRDGRRSWNVSKLHSYLDKLERGGSVEEGAERLTEGERHLEKLLFGLRMNEGVDLALTDAPFLDALRLEKFQLFIKEGLLIKEGNRIKVTDKGRLVLDELSSQLV